MSRVLFIAPWYYEHSYPTLVGVLRDQTQEDHSLYLIHDGPIPTGKRLRCPGNVHPVETEYRHNDWGHTLRQIALRDAASWDWDFLVHTNADNYYAPTFCAEMVSAFQPGDVAVFCNMLHNDWGYRYRETEWQRCRIDCGCVMVRREVALEIGWRARHKTADWEGYMEPIVKQYGRKQIRKIHPVLFIHN